MSFPLLKASVVRVWGLAMNKRDANSGLKRGLKKGTLLPLVPIATVNPPPPTPTSPKPLQTMVFDRGRPALLHFLYIALSPSLPRFARRRNSGSEAAIPPACYSGWRTAAAFPIRAAFPVTFKAAASHMGPQPSHTRPPFSIPPPFHPSLNLYLRMCVCVIGRAHV